MEFPINKEWMGENNLVSDLHVRGVKNFVKYAKRNLKSEEIPCPCTRCRNGKSFKGADVELHLFKWGMQQDYMFWIFHGENEFEFIPEQLSATKKVQIEDDSLVHGRLNDLVNDAYGVHIMQSNLAQETNVRCEDSRDQEEGFAGNVDSGVYQDKDYIRLKDAAAKPLYPNCNQGHTTLYAMVGLHNLKSRFGLSGNSVTEFLSWANDLLPKDNTMPDNYPIMKRILKGLGIKYKSIHACKYDCILYWKEHKEKLVCPICKEPSFEQKIVIKSKDVTKIDTKVPQKVLKYVKSGDVMSRLARLANGPNFVAHEYVRYRLNGFLFSSSAAEIKLVGKQNNGISLKSLTYFRASSKDKNLKEAETTYYGIIRQIFVLDYASFKETVFYCDWVKVEDKNACLVDPDTNMVMVDLTKLKEKYHLNNEPFVCSFQNLKQVFYVKSPKNNMWSMVLHSPKRLTTFVDNIEAPTVFQSALDDNLALKNFLDSLDE